MEQRETVLDPPAYLDSVTMEEGGWTEIYELNGAALYRVGTDHFVILTSEEHEHHDGHALLRRVIPPSWERFFAAVNQDLHFQAHHYGPTL